MPIIGYKILRRSVKKRGVLLTVWRIYAIIYGELMYLFPEGKNTGQAEKRWNRRKKNSIQDKETVGSLR